MANRLIPQKWFAAVCLAFSFSFNSFAADTTKPVIAVITPIPTFTNDTTPNYTFSSTEAGTILYKGLCSSVTTTVAAPTPPATTVSVTLTLNALVPGKYSTCSFQVKDAAGNISLAKVINTFTIDTTKPVLAQVTAVPTFTNDTTPNYTFSSTEAGTIIYTGACSSTVTKILAPVLPATTKSLTLTFKALIAGKYSTCKIQVKDAAGNISLARAINTFTIDLTRPVLSLVTAIPLFTNDTTPSFTFSSSEGGALTYTGSCISTVTSVLSPVAPATKVNKTITFAALPAGTYSTCGIKLTDVSGNISSLNVNSFTIDVTKPILKLVTLVPSLSKDNTPSFTFSSSEGGTIIYTGACSSVSTTIGSPVPPALTINKLITFNVLPDGIYSTCKIQVKDVAGNISLSKTINSFTIDNSMPLLTQLTPISTPSKNTTPTYSFSSSKAGAIQYTGGCSSPQTTAVLGNNNITFNTLTDGTYSTCAIKVLDSLGNLSQSLLIPSFTIDTIKPVVFQVLSVPTYNFTHTPTYSFSTTKAGVINYGGPCLSTQTSALAGNNTITFSSLVDGFYSTCTLTIVDLSGNISTVHAINSFTIDSTKPTLTQVTPVPFITNDTTPSYSFSSSEAGIISYGGGCTSSQTNAVQGVNTITFNALAVGLYNSCYLSVKDATNNISSLLLVSYFSVELLPPIGANLTLNDTAITLCGDYALGNSLIYQNNLVCSAVGAGVSVAGIDSNGDPVPAGQDALVGRDALGGNSNTNGVAGFDFTKLDANGNVLAENAVSWSCVKDNVTGLIWENKTADGGLRDRNWTYSWYDINTEVNYGNVGFVDNGNNCFDSTRCDTEKYVADVNASNLCGASNWRLPRTQELISIVANDRIAPAIDGNFFPNTISNYYWTTVTYANTISYAAIVTFNTGSVADNTKSSLYYVRLVRSP